MRVEATIPDSRGTAMAELADELGLSRSQLIDEALSLFIMVVLEVRRGRRIVAKDDRETVALTTPSLAAMEWKYTKLQLPDHALAAIQTLIENPPEPAQRLRDAAKRHPK